MHLVVTVKLLYCPDREQVLFQACRTLLHASLNLSGRPCLSMCLAGVVVLEGRCVFSLQHGLCGNCWFIFSELYVYFFPFGVQVEKSV